MICGLCSRLEVEMGRKWKAKGTGEPNLRLRPEARARGSACDSEQQVVDHAVFGAEHVKMIEWCSRPLLTQDLTPGSGLQEPPLVSAIDCAAHNTTRSPPVLFPLCTSYQPRNDLQAHHLTTTSPPPIEHGYDQIQPRRRKRRHHQ